MDQFIDLMRTYSDLVDIEQYESFDFFELKIHLRKTKKLFNLTELNSFKKYISERDRASFTIEVDEDGDLYEFSFNETKDEQLLEEINTISLNEPVSIKYKISKFEIQNTRSIYNTQLFTSNLRAKNLSQIFTILSNSIKLDKLNILELQDNTHIGSFRSNLLYIKAKRNPELHLTSIKNSNLSRDDILRKRELHCSISELSKYSFIPEDFINQSFVKLEGDLYTFLDKLSIFLSLTYLANVSNIDGDKVSFLIFGHRHLELKHDFTNIVIEKAKSIFDVYSWVYSYDDITDKLGLSRNIISRHFTFTDHSWRLPVEAINYIQSAHSIYLKDNVEKYIETKNKVAEFATERMWKEFLVLSSFRTQKK